MTVRKCCRKSKKEVVPNFQNDDAKTSTNAPSQTDPLLKVTLLYHNFGCGISLPSNNFRSLLLGI